MKKLSKRELDLYTRIAYCDKGRMIVTRRQWIEIGDTVNSLVRKGYTIKRGWDIVRGVEQRRIFNRPMLEERQYAPE